MTVLIGKSLTSKARSPLNFSSLSPAFLSLAFLSLAIVLASLVGCSDGRLKTYPAKGKVAFKTGSPVHVGTIELKSREHGIQARGSIDKDGNFILTTYVDGDGAVAGVHDCVVVQFIVTEEMKDFKPSALGVIHPRFASYNTSGLSVEIKADQANELKIEVEGVKKFLRTKKPSTTKNNTTSKSPPKNKLLCSESRQDFRMHS